MVLMMVLPMVLVLLLSLSLTTTAGKTSATMTTSAALKQIEDSLLDAPFKLTSDASRVLLKRGRLMKLNGGVFQLRHFVLSNDVLLWAKAERGGKLRYRGHINLGSSLFQKAAPAPTGKGRATMAPDFLFQIVRMDVDPKSYTLKAESFADWYEWTTLIEDRVDSFASQLRDEHEKLITKLLRDESRTSVVGSTASSSSSAVVAAAAAASSAASSASASADGSPNEAVSVPLIGGLSSGASGGRVNEMFVSLCDSLVQTEKLYADTLDCILKEYWIPLCQSSIVDARNEVTMLFGAVEKIAMSHVEVLSALEDGSVESDIKALFGPIVAEANLVLQFLKKRDVLQLYTAFASSSATRLDFYDQLVSTRAEFADFVAKKNKQLPAHSNLRKLIEQPLERLRTYVSITIRMRRFCPPTFAPTLDVLSDALTAALGDAKVSRPISPRDLDSSRPAGADSSPMLARASSPPPRATSPTPAVVRSLSPTRLGRSTSPTPKPETRGRSPPQAAAAVAPLAQAPPALGSSEDDDDTELDDGNKSPSRKRRSKNKIARSSGSGVRRTMPPQHKPPPLPSGQVSPPDETAGGGGGDSTDAGDVENENAFAAVPPTLVARIEGLESTNKSLIMFVQQLQREVADLRAELFHSRRQSRAIAVDHEKASRRLSMHVQTGIEKTPAKQKSMLELISEKHEM